MKKRDLSINNRKINFLFPLALFFAFAVCAMVVLLFATSVYRKTLDSSVQSDTVNTALSYISEKIHTNGSADHIILSGDDTSGIFPENTDSAIALCSVYNDSSYYTCIYVYDGYLRELTFKEGCSVSPSTGTALLQINEINAEYISDDLIMISCTDADGKTGTQLISLHDS